ncbi:MAG: hypothetical protein M3Z26_07110 [Bacteroidota bacterium]|nr:hypothetical protein [Bacteroidota bacterium]
MKKIILLITAFLFTAHLFAQDKIYKLRGPIIKAKVIEIGTDEIKYKLAETTDGPVYVVDKSTLNRIEFADGRVEKYKLSFKDPANYEGQLRKAVKINFLAPLLGYTQFSFEKSISPLKSYELGFGIIGAGKNYQIDNFYYNGQNTSYKRNAFGGFLEAGYKFNKLPDFLRSGTRMSHIMQGTYVKPTATIGYYSDNALNYKTGSPVLEKRNNLFGAIILNFGHQWVFGDKFLIDLYYGFGYAFDNVKNDYNDNYNSSSIYNHFVIQKAGSGANLGLSGGLKVGFLIK